MYKIVLAFIFGYIIYKGIQFFRTIFTAVNKSANRESVRETERTRSKIDQKDVIDAQFEEIEIKDKTSDSK
jgi:hypothetical protein